MKSHLRSVTTDASRTPAEMYAMHSGSPPSVQLTLHFVLLLCYALCIWCYGSVMRCSTDLCNGATVILWYRPRVRWYSVWRYGCDTRCAVHNWVMVLLDMHSPYSATTLLRVCTVGPRVWCYVSAMQPLYGTELGYDATAALWHGPSVRWYHSAMHALCSATVVLCVCYTLLVNSGATAVLWS